MFYLLFGLVCGLLCGIPFDFGQPGWKSKWAILTLVWGGISGLVCWLALPQFIGPLWGERLWGCLIAGFALNLAVTHLMYNHAVETVRLFTWVVVLFLVPLSGAVRSCSAFHADEYRSFVARDVAQRTWKTDMAPVNTAHIRMVSEEQAEWLAKKALGQSDQMGLGSRFKVGDATIQKVGDQLMWVAPLEFQGFRAWQTASVSPGYVLVDAEDPSKPAVLKDGYKLRYLPSAFLGDKLERHLYDHGYRMVGTTDYSFEIDDEGQPFYVAVVYEKTIGYFGESILGIAVVDPQTGDIVPYSIELAPKWIDRIVPSEFAQDRLEDYGKYVDGWVNSWWGEDNVNVPTVVKHRKKQKEGGQNAGLDYASLWLTWGDDGNAYWFAGLTSTKSSDDSLVGFVLMDSRTGHTREYQLPGGVDANGVMEVVNSAVSNYDGWHATQPILYNIYGELTWAVPVISETNIFQRLALVRASNAKVALGDDKNSALENYKQMLTREGNTEIPSAQAHLKSAAGQVERIGCPVLDGTSVCYLTLLNDHPQRIFAGSVKGSITLSLTRPGDMVEIGYIETFGASVPIDQFKLNLPSPATRQDPRDLPPAPASLLP